MIRLQKLLAGAGLGSRRSIEEWIRAGRITLNGRVAQLGDRARPGDDIRLDGKPVVVPEAGAAGRRLLAYHKPLDEVTTRRDPQGRRTVFQSLPDPGVGRWISIGRLDVNTSGLLLFTTDGELAHRLMHPASEVEREYRVTVRGQPTPEVLARLRKGVMLEDGPARFDRIDAVRGAGPNATYTVVLREGRNREVRRMWSAVGHEVIRLARIRYGPVRLPPDLPRGHWRELSPEVLDGVAPHPVGSGYSRRPASSR